MLRFFFSIDKNENVLQCKVCSIFQCKQNIPLSFIETSFLQILSGLFPDCWMYLQTPFATFRMLSLLENLNKKSSKKIFLLGDFKILKLKILINFK